MSVTVRIRLEVDCSVDLPDGYEHAGQACDDPAIEAAVEGIPQKLEIYLWGEDKPPACLWYEVSDQDAEILEDEREENPG